MMNFEQQRFSDFKSENYRDLFENLFEKRQTPQASSSYNHVSNSLAKSNLIFKIRFPEVDNRPVRWAIIAAYYAEFPCPE